MSLKKEPRNLSLTPPEANCILIWCESITLGVLTPDAKDSLDNGRWQKDAKRVAKSLVEKIHVLASK